MCEQQQGTSQSPENKQFFKDEYLFDNSRFTHDIFEYEQGQKSILVRGRLRKNLQFWRDIGANSFILDMIEHGYKIPFYSSPEQGFYKNNLSALSEPEFVSEAIQDLLDRSLIEKVCKPPTVVNPLTVSVQSCGKKRLILDLRNVNKHIWKQSVKFDDLRVALSYMQKHAYMIKWDLHSAYHFVEIYRPHTDFLGFSWTSKDNVTHFYKFLSMPFGLSSACYLFTKLTRPLIAKWRGEGKMVLMYLDDGFGCASERERALNLASQIKHDLILSGFVPKVEKCIWVPVQLLQLLGVTLNSLEGTIYISEHRLNKTRNTITQILADLKVHRRLLVRKVSSLVGQIISMSIVIGHVTQIMTRSLSIDILKAYSWESYIPLSPESIEQIKFWQSNLEKVNTRNISDSDKYSKIVYSDASTTGYAGYEVNTANGVSHGMWDVEESQKSSTWRELTAVYRVLLSLSHILANQSVRWFTDNQGVSAIAVKGSMNSELQNIAIEIFRVCMSKCIHLSMEWIPRSLNEKADYYSKIVDHDDWGVSFEIMSIIQSRFGSLSVDWFASNHNAKLPRFYSRFWNDSCAGIDAFTESWSTDFGLFVPPIPIVNRVIKKMCYDKAKGVLVIPAWTSAVFWPLICPNGDFIHEVVDWIDLPNQRQFYTCCKNGKGIFGNSDLKFRMLALMINYS